MVSVKLNRNFHETIKPVNEKLELRREFTIELWIIKLTLTFQLWQQ